MAAFPQPITLETEVQLSQSMIWRLQREFYVQRGLKAWSEDQIPNFITNNPFIAEIYSRIIFSFFQDCLRLGLPNGTPLRILELGAGTGKLAYLVLQRVVALLNEQGIAPEGISYCMTDCSEDLLDSWRANIYLAEFFRKGILQFERLDLGEELTPAFLISKDSNRAAGPLVVIANYVFDSLPQDAFVIKEGELSEALVTTRQPTPTGGERPVLSQFQLSYKYVPIAPHRYTEPAWSQILEYYRTCLPGATVLFPSHTLKVLQALDRLTDGRMLVLAADKGLVHEDALRFSQGAPTIEFHSANCFSQMVNFDAISKYFQAIGGQALLPEKHFSGFNICGFVLGHPGESFPQAISVYKDTQAAFGPDDLFILLAWLNAHMDEMSLPQILAVLRLTCWDPIAFMRLFPGLARQLQAVTAERSDLRAAVMKVWANHYPVVSGEKEVAFQIGVVLLGLSFFEDALPMFRISKDLMGPSAATSYNVGLCFQGLSRRSEALDCMKEACKLDPKFEPARLSLQKLERELASG